MADIPGIAREFRNLERHLAGLSRAVTGRIDELLKEQGITDADRGELTFLTRALRPPIEKAIVDVGRLAKLIGDLKD